MARREFRRMRIGWYEQLILYVETLRIMTIAFQLALFGLIAILFLLVVGVPVAFASPGGWSSNKNIVWRSAFYCRPLLFVSTVTRPRLSASPRCEKHYEVLVFRFAFTWHEELFRCFVLCRLRVPRLSACCASFSVRLYLCLGRS